MNTEGMSIEKMRAIVLVATLRAQELLTGGVSNKTRSCGYSRRRCCKNCYQHFNQVLRQ